ncbi:MAG: hypothetical protein JXR07_07705 [Reichenbachiella sp.]
MKKYIFEFIAVFFGIIGGFLVEEFREKQNEIEDTQKALEFIYADLFADSIYYDQKIKRIKKNIEYLELGLNKTSMSVGNFRKLHAGLRRAEDYFIRDYGVTYLTHNIDNPRVQDESILTLITTFHKTSTESGDYGKFNKLYWEVTNENYVKLFEVFPNFFSSDTTLSNREIRENIEIFLSDPYWIGRINLTYRECSGLIIPVFEANRYWNNEIMRQLRTEIPDYIPQRISD